MDAGKILETVLFPRWMDQILESVEPTRDEPMPSTNAIKLPEKGRWFYSLSNMVAGVLLLRTGVLLLRTSRDIRSMAGLTSAEMAREVHGPTMCTG